MAAKLPVLSGDTTTCSVMSFGFDPYLSEQNPFFAAQEAVIQSVARLVASGCDYKLIYLTLQEYFEKMRNDPVRFGKPVASLLGAFLVQEKLSLAAIGGKDSMSGSFDAIDVPPTLVSFAIAPNEAAHVLSPELKQADSYISLFKAPRTPENAYDFERMKAQFTTIHTLMRDGKIRSAWALSMGGVVEGIVKMAIGNDIGFTFDGSIDKSLLFCKDYGSILVESEMPLPGAVLLGHTTNIPEIVFPDSVLSLSDAKDALFKTLEPVYPTLAPAKRIHAPRVFSDARNLARPLVRIPRPKAVIPVFPGTNCEYDTARAIEKAGGESHQLSSFEISTLSALNDCKT